MSGQKGISLRKKLMAAMLLTSTVVLTLVTIGYAFSDWLSSRAEVFDRLGSHAAIIGHNSVAALVFADRQAAEKNLLSLQGEENIVGAALFDGADRLFSQFQRDSRSLPLTIPPQDQGVVEGYFYVLVPIQLDDEVIGHILVLSELGNWYRHQLWRLAILLGLFLMSLLVAVLLSHHAERMVTMPVLRLAETARKITGSRNYALRADKVSEDEIGVLVDDFNGMLEQIQQRDDELQEVRRELEDKVVERTARLFELNEKLKHQAYHDPLTGLANRVTFDNALKTAINAAQRHDSRLAVLFLDLDRFKGINDTLGHTVGDKLLIEVARRLSSRLRSFDLLARLGGDEFAVLLQDVTPGIAADLAASLIDAISAPTYIDGYNLLVTTSIGISMYPDDGVDAIAILKNADTAMYSSKASGRNQLCFYTEEMNANAERRLYIESKLRLAVAEKEFEVFYQPKFDTHTQQLNGIEALIRWPDRNEGFIRPSEFIPLAEDCGLIGDVDLWVLEKACRDVLACGSDKVASLLLSVNFSPAHFIRQDVFHRIAEVLTRTGFSARRLELEVTETLVVSEVVGAYEQMKKIRDLGVEISIDDFGVGYSSLSRLKQLPLNTLKIDRSFIEDIGNDPDDEVLVRTIIDMAHNLNLKVVAEGVETIAQFEFVRQHNCDSVQGFLFSKPLTLTELVALAEATTLAAAD